jgi:photosystem II stability/assembly factor-like uncharacterized protein
MRRPISLILVVVACACLARYTWRSSDQQEHPATGTSGSACLACHSPAADDDPEGHLADRLPAGHPPIGQRVAPAAPGEGELQADRLSYDQLRFRDPATGRIPPGMRARELAFARGHPVNRGRPGHGLSSATDGAEKVAGWISRGPGLVGGRVRALAFDLADETHRTLLAGGVSGGLWRTTDDGDSWTLLTPPGEMHNISCIEQDPRPGHQHIWYYGTGEGKGSTSEASRDDTRHEGWGLHGNGIYKSSDGGLTWSVLPATSSGTPTIVDSRFDYVWRIAVDPSQTVLDEVYAAAYGVIYRSVDGGAHWTAVLGDGENPSRFADVVIADDGTVYAGIGADGAQHGVFRSPDGVVWTDITPTPWNSTSRVVLALAPSDQTRLYVTASEVDGTYICNLYLYRYLFGNGSGGGGSWSDRTAYIMNLPHDELGPWPYYTQRGYNQCTTVHPTDADVVFLGGVHVWRSTDAFATFYNRAFIGGWLYEGHHADIHDIVFQPSSTDVVYSASDGGVHKCEQINAADPVWISKNNGFITTQFYTVAIDEELAGSQIVVGGTQDNGTLWTGSAMPSATWVEPLGGDGAHCHVIDAAAGEYYLSYYRANLFYFVLDGDGNELASKRVNPDTDDYFLFMNPFVADPVDERIMYLGGPDGIWRNTNIEDIPAGNQDPTLINWGRLTNEPAGENVSALAVSKTPDRILYYGTADGSLRRLDAAHTAPDGSTPLDLNVNASFPPGFVSSIAIDPLDELRVLVAFSNYMVSSLWLTEDGGGTWTEIEGNLGGDDGPAVLCVRIIPVGEMELYAVGTSTGLYSTSTLDGAATIWTRESPDLIGNVIVEDIAARASDGLLVAATHGRGIFSVHIPPETGVLPTPERGYLAQNTPNPFNPATEITFRVPAPGQATLEVFDARGRLVRRLFDAEVGTDPQHVRWEARDDRGRSLAAGTYVYRLQSPGFVESRKMTLIK